MNENHMELLNEFHQLINTFCEISCTQHDYAGSLSKELNQSIEKAIHAEFHTLLDLHIEKLTASTGIELYALQTKNGITIPQRRRRWYTFWKKTPNPAAKAVEGEIYGNSELFFQDLIERTTYITELKQLLEQALAAQNVQNAAPEEAPASEEPPLLQHCDTHEELIRIWTQIKQTQNNANATPKKPPQQPETPAEPTPAPSPATTPEKPAQNITVTTSEEAPASEEPPQQPEAPTEQTPAPSPAPAQEEPVQDVTITTSEQAPASEEPPQQPEAPTEPTPAPSPAPAPEEPAETWEEEHAIPSKTLKIPSER